MTELATGAPTRALFLVTDFGLQDTYVGQMKAVIAGIAPAAPVHDVVHDLPPQSVSAAASALEELGPWLPSGAIVCAVVDPGVGTDRSALAVEFRRDDGATAVAVAPDNGVLTPWLAALEVKTAVRLDEAAAPVSTTFHGRDVFAPAAARVAAGAMLTELGAPVDPEGLVRLALPMPGRLPEGVGAANGGGWVGQVVRIDRFGTLVTNLRRLPHLDGGPWRVAVQGVDVGGLRGTFADVEPGAPVALIGSSGRLQIAVRNGNAHTALNAGIGAEVTVRRAAGDPR